MPLTIFVDFAPPPDVLRLLEAGTHGHHLIFAKTAVASVLVKAERDPAFVQAEVAFGQPDLAAIAEASRLKWIHVSSSGITRYDTPEFRAFAAQRKLMVTNSADVYAEACAVHVFSFLLAHARRLPWALKSRAANGTAEWNALRSSSTTLRGQTALILGFGSIGKRLVELLQPLHMNILAYRRTARGDEGVPVVNLEDLPHALAGSDHVFNILPDNAGSRQFFTAARLARLKPGAVFYNIGRGVTVDQNALVEALRSGRLAAAWLDVTDPEPLPENHPLLSAPNCFITPHIAGGHFDETKTLVNHFLKNFERFVRGEPLADRVI